MAKISRSALLPYSAERMFALVNDIAAYPKYMTGCIGAEILQWDAGSVTARLTLGKAGLRYAFTTCNTLEAPQRIFMTLVEGPFRKFQAEWRFDALSESASKTSLEMQFEFSMGLVDAALRALFESTANEMVGAIAKRAEQLYGKV